MNAVTFCRGSLAGLCLLTWLSAGEAQAHARRTDGALQHGWHRFRPEPIDPFFVPSTPSAPEGSRLRASRPRITLEDLWSAMRPRPAEQHLLDVAGGLVGTRSMRWMDPSVPDECSGYVRAAYSNVGVDILWAEPRFDENAVGAIYRLARERGATHLRTPAPGDLVFFRETYDRNRDGQRNDGRTHIGIVERVQPDGTVVFLHRIRNGVMRSAMHPKRPRVHRDPNTKEIVNDWLRGPQKGTRAYLTGELFAGYASFTVLAAREDPRAPLVATLK